MKRPQLFGARVARRLFLSYTIPLLVLMVSGLLLPLFVWTWLDGFRIDSEIQTELSQRADAYRQSALQLEETRSVSLRSPTGVQRRRLQLARDDFRNSGIRMREWIEAHPDPESRRLYRDADQQVRLWLRVDSAPVSLWDPARRNLDRLVAVCASRRDQSRDEFRQMDALRRSAVVLIPFLAVVLSLVIGRSVAIGLTTPLVDLTRAALRIREGAAGDEMDPGADPEDEIGDLRRAFRTMSGAIARRESELNARNAALAAVGRRLESVLNSTDEGIAMLDRNGRFSVVNDRFGSLVQIPSEILLSSHIRAIAPRLISRFRDTAAARRELRRIVRSPDTTWSDSLEMAGDRKQVLRVFTAPVRAPAPAGGTEGLLGRIVVLRDITRESEVDRMKTEFVSTVSHELRTPLTAIHGYVDLILRGQTGAITPVQEEFLRMASENTERLTALINDILDISRIEQGGTPLRRVPVRYAPVVDRVVQLLGGQATERSIELTSQIDDPECIVEGDRDRIFQVLNNLVSNALKYTRPGGTVKVLVRSDAETVVTEVADTGIGIAPDDLPHVFDRFYRADNSTTRTSGGTGLGLAISKSLVERMGGSIHCDSKLGRGSTFTFALPGTDTDAAEAWIDDSAPVRLLLLADPRPDTRSRMANELRRSGFAISPAANDAEAWRRARGLRPDAILLEATTAGIDGPQLVRQMQGNTATRAIPIYLTGLLDHAQVLRQPEDITAPLRASLENPESQWLLFGDPDTTGAALDVAPSRFTTLLPGADSPRDPLSQIVVAEFEHEALVRLADWLEGHPQPVPQIVLAGPIPETVRPLGSPERGSVPPGRHARVLLERLGEARPVAAHPMPADSQP